MCSQKDQPHCIHFTVGVNNINYPEDVGTSTAEKRTIKILLNSTLFTNNTKLIALDIKKIYLQIVLDYFEYMWIQFDVILDEIKTQYKLTELEHNGWVYFQIQKVCTPCHNLAW